jgi:hypothetical protein
MSIDQTADDVNTSVVSLLEILFPEVMWIRPRFCFKGQQVRRRCDARTRDLQSILTSIELRNLERRLTTRACEIGCSKSESKTPQHRI